MKKTDREIVHDKFGGKCAYCGCKLLKGWHVDHLSPVWRSRKYVVDEHGKRVWCSIKQEYKSVSIMEKPHNDVLENYMPSCASCNILKGGGDLECFRIQISNFINSLNSYTNQYKFAKRYGLIIETGKHVEFYFEKL